MDGSLRLVALFSASCLINYTDWTYVIDLISAWWPYVIAGVCFVGALVWLFTAPAPGKNGPELVPRPTKTWSDLQKAEDRWVSAVRAHGATGDQYLLIGCGFLGCHIVKALLLRGEQKIRVFDLAVCPLLRTLLDDNPGRLEYVKGDVTNSGDLTSACKGVHTVYCTFAIIRYWERQPHQRALSQRINVDGTEAVLKAVKSSGTTVRRFVHTSTSHVCVTSAHVTYGPSDPAATNPHMLDEDSPYVTEANR